MENFRPSIDWGREVVHSVLWILGTWTACAAIILVLAVLLLRYTTWGQRFWRITGAYFNGRSSVPVWGLLAAMLLSVMIDVRIQVLLSYYSNDVYSALQVAVQGVASHDGAHRDSGIHGFWMALVIFCILASIHVLRIVLDTYLAQHFIIRWRVWLTDRLTTQWLTGRAYYRDRFSGRPIDNPDQRIQHDIDVFTTGVGTGPNVPTYYSTSIVVFGAVDALVSVASFTVILWRLSGTLTLFGVGLPKALFWIVLAYVLIASVVAFWIGRPLIGLSFRNEQTNAAFRYALVRLRDSAEAVAFYRGERAERRELTARFDAIIANYRRYVRRTIGLVGWNFSATQAVSPLPLLLQAPRLFAGTIKLGDVTQSGTAFGKIQSGLSFFRTTYSQFASYDAVIERLYGLVEAGERSRELPTLASLPSPDGSVRLHGVEVRTPGGGQLIDPLDVTLLRGDSLVISGASGTGKTSLIRSLAELWPAAGGSWHRPAGEHETMFVSQLPYVPLGTLRAVVSYPLRPLDVDDDRLRDALAKVSLPQLRDRLDEVRDWATILSPGEQQRIAFARVLLTAPKAVFLDEATSALDEGLEFALYLLLRSELPDLIVVSVGHQRSIDQHHRHRLELLGGGAWRLDAVAARE
ncbi:vitamin B12 transport ATP-binding protein BacA [Mycolicibacterium madagascariense]|uniref:Vitamin B12 transport ATP-binding protein BacA n=1 Tax=Mycolicibacterium madagascariense TaxID=212765 RepID=A0A7I7XFL8_9MYCO|nr:ABC transporter ATP-binding protein/permease [Mycolicibacterium madagascariense]MCV7013983.1 ABC transporter ATP-binding protein/permease [Mycolicibacterium madagascariense]BBZ27977.1 vitamin B12 transport ATP-binding protein BacA [Mycolicibacterium madagascariense]